MSALSLGIGRMALVFLLGINPAGRLSGYLPVITFEVITLKGASTISGPIDPFKLGSRLWHWTQFERYKRLPLSRVA